MEREGEGTKFTIDRKIFSSDIWFDSPWKLKIWIYLLGNANHKKGKFMGMDIERGQLIRSYRTIRKDCGYKVGYRMKYPSLSTVRRCCEGLTKDARTVQRTVQCGTLFTIINYSDLQPMQKKRTVQRTQESSYNDRTMTVQNKNVKNVKNKDKDKSFSFGVSVTIPKNLHLTDQMIIYAKSKNVNGDLRDMFEGFCIHHRKKGNKFKDWYAAWQTWVRNDLKFNPAGQDSATDNFYPDMVIPK